MLKINEAAVIYTDENPFGNITWNNTSEIDRLKEKKYQGFKAGVEFAQRWISVEDELPEEQGYYLVIAPHSFPKNCNIVVAEFYEDNKTFYSESSDSPITDATHWRPIELK